VWICLDALDGSANLRAGLPPWGFSAALVEEGQSVAGLVCDLASGRRWWASRGRGAWVDGRPALPRRVGLVAAGSRADALHELPAWVERVRIPGSSSLSLCYVASGSLGGYRGLAAENVRPQDVAAAAVILREAGACLVDSSRSPLMISPNPEERLKIVAAPDHASARDLLT
jgi:3'(2'), 5'-bisphosphate nucleotidase